VSEPVLVALSTVEGPARAHLHRPDHASPAAGTLLLGHGAGGGVGAADLQALTTLQDHGWSVVLLEQPWRVAGARVATAPPRLDAAWRDMVPALLEECPELAGRLVVGGRSAGARVACRTATGSARRGLPVATGVLCLAFPLHPPGRPERSRAGELRAPPSRGIPTLVVQGDRDPFGSPDAVITALGADPGPATVHGVTGTHAPTRDLVGLRTAVASWLDGLP